MKAAGADEGKMEQLYLKKKKKKIVALDQGTPHTLTYD